MPARTDKETDILLEAIKDLYVSMRKKWIMQKKDGFYSHISQFPLHDDMLRKHIRGKNTIGVFARSDYLKFLTFDVDIDDVALERHFKKVKMLYGNSFPKTISNNTLARWITLKLIDALINDFAISKGNLLVSFSGSKGYHVSLFFNDESVTEARARKFYDIVLDHVGATDTEIEFRPMVSMGVKPPLGINKKTGNYCHLVDIDKLEHIPDNAIFNVEKVDGKQFLENLVEFEKLYDHQEKLVQKRKQEIKKQHVEAKKEKLKQDAKEKLDLTAEKQQDFEDVVDEVNIEIPIGFEDRMEQVLDQTMLLDHTTPRHNTTYLLCVYLKDRGKSQSETKNLVQKVIYNTFLKRRSLIDQSRTLDFCLSEVARLCNYVFKRHKSSKRIVKAKSIRLYKNEILEALKSSKKPLMILAFAMILHSKKYADKNGIFYMTYDQMKDYGVKGNREINSKKLDQLESAEFLEIVERNRQQEKSFKSLPNLYQLKIAPNEADNFIEFNVNDAISLEDVVVELISKEEIKKILTRRVFETQFKEHYRDKTS